MNPTPQGVTLLPCPFCGNEDIDPSEWLDQSGKSGPGCSKCGCICSSVEQWNTRLVNSSHPPAPEQPSVERPACPKEIVDAITSYGDARADQDANGAPTTSHLRLNDCIHAVRDALQDAATPTAEPVGEPMSQQFIRAALGPVIALPQFPRPWSVKAYNVALGDTGDYMGVTDILDSNGKVVFQMNTSNEDLDEDIASHIVSCVNSASPAAPEAAKPEQCRREQRGPNEYTCDCKPGECPVQAAKPEQQAQAGEPQTLVARLRNTPNWMRESYGNWKDGTITYDRAPFEAADALEENERLHNDVLADLDIRINWLEQAITKKDAALKACVEALEELVEYLEAAGFDASLDEPRAAITQAKEQLK